MKKNIANYIKYNKQLYELYYFIASFCLNMMKRFVKTDEKLILYNSFAGRKYDDSPKAIYEAMKQDDRFDDYHLVWAFHDPSVFADVVENRIKTDTVNYFMTALKARVWITNSSVERGLKFKNNNTIYLNTWHGTPIKKMGSDIDSKNKSFKAKGEGPIDIMMSQGRYETEIFSRTFKIPKERFLEAGLPRNDVLASYTSDDVKKIKNKLKIGLDKKVILYCPTFREYAQDENKAIKMEPPMDLSKWEEALGSEYVLLVRAHYEVSKTLNISDTQFVKDMTNYPSLNELYMIADMLISDYSSAFFDFSITGKPMFHFTYDYDEYAKKRGMYFDIREYVSGADNEDALVGMIKTINKEEEAGKTIQFRDTFVDFYGDSAAAALDELYRKILS